MFDTPIIVASFFAIACFVIYVLIDVAISKKDRIKKIDRESRLTRAYDDLGLERDGEKFVELDEEVTGFAKIEKQILQVMGINVDKSLKAARYDAMMAGFDSVNAPVHLLFFRRVGGYLMAMLGALLIMKGGLLPISAGALLMLIGLFGPKLFVSNSKQKRQKKLLRSFPDGLDLMVVCVESGLALDAAINRVADELGSAHPLFAKELGKTRLELALLNNRSQALMNLADRIDLVAYRSLVAALIQTERFGTNLTDTLRVLSDDYRQTRLMLAEEKAGRLPALMAIPLITFLLPAFVLIVMGPMVVRLKAQGGLTGSR
jgi:tight adherence protein C